MTNKNIVITTKIEHETDRENTISLLFELGAEGVEEKETELLIYFPSEVIKNISLLEQVRNICGTIEIAELPEINWNQAWESNFEPIFVDNFAQIRASFHDEKPNYKYNIIIDPKMSFGTGHHATTFQMIKAMSCLDFNEKTVFDCGSGTGILAILAEKMGAKHTIALDNDQWCFENCEENIILNQCTNTIPICGELNEIIESFDIILANINRNFLLEHLNKLAQKLVNQGYLIISGFLTTEKKMLLDEALAHGLVADSYLNMDNWACILLKKIN